MHAVAPVGTNPSAEKVPLAQASLGVMQPDLSTVPTGAVVPAGHATQTLTPFSSLMYWLALHETHAVLPAAETV